MNPTIETMTRTRQSANAIVDTLPEPHYTRNFQPDYPDTDALLEAVHELHHTRTVTSTRNVDAARARLAALATGETLTPLIFGDSCNERIKLTTPIGNLVDDTLKGMQVIHETLPQAIVVPRRCGQSAKPRSSELQQLENGASVPSYMGDMVNDEAIDRRTPDPTRMVAAGVQAGDLAAGLEKAVGHHVTVAHEALLLPYEQSFIRTDPETGKKYSLSGDILWVGERTNNPDGAHVTMLSGVENPVGVKIGPSSNREHIARLQQKLNPENKPGKLIFMVRMGEHDEAVMDEVLDSIKQNAPDSVLQWDIHGVKRSLEDGTKLRYTGDIIDSVKRMAAACGRAGLTLHGLHLETMVDDSRLECVDFPNQRPIHPGDVDPRLNPRQTQHVLRSVAGYLLQKAVSGTE